MKQLFSQQLNTSYGRVVLIHSAVTRHTFPRHFHETFPFGVIESGGLGFQYRGKTEMAVKGCVNLANPGEVHDGFPLSEQGWQYRMFYMDCRFVHEINLQEKTRSEFPWFSSGVLQDPALAGELAALHRDIQTGWLTPLSIETRLVTLLSRLIHRHAQIRPLYHLTRQTQESMESICEFIRESCTATLTLKHLADACGFSPGYFIRAFKKQTGLTPHQFQVVCRLERAIRQLQAGNSISQTAVDNGFVDQSHFTHTFRHFYGYAPGEICSH